MKDLTMTCNHQRTTERWVTTDYFGEDAEGRWEYDTRSTVVDLDTHRCKCTQCGLVMYYSGRARAFYEDGVRSHVLGLGG